MSDAVAAEAMRDVQQQPEISSATTRADGNSRRAQPAASSTPPPRSTPSAAAVAKEAAAAVVAVAAAAGTEPPPYPSANTSSRGGVQPPARVTGPIPLDSSGQESSGGYGGGGDIASFVVDGDDDDQGAPGSAKHGRSVAKAMAEAILDEGYIASTPPFSTAATTTVAYVPRSPAPTHQHRPTRATTNGDRQQVAAAAPGAAAQDGGMVSPAPVIAAAVVDDSLTRDHPQQQEGQSYTSGVGTPSRQPSTPDRRSSDGRGVDAPFGHAIIIEEHVRAGVSTSSASPLIPVVSESTGAPAAAPARRAAVTGRSLLSSGKLSTQGRSSGAANGVIKTSSASAAAVAAIASAAGALVPTPPTGSGSRHNFSLGRRSNGSSRARNGLDKEIEEEEGEKAENDARVAAEWCATEDIGSNDGFLVLEGGGRSSVGRTSKRMSRDRADRSRSTAAPPEGPGGEKGSGVDENADGNNLWPVSAAGSGLPEAEGGWGHVSTNGRLEEEDDEDGLPGGAGNAGAPSDPGKGGNEAWSSGDKRGLGRDSEGHEDDLGLVLSTVDQGGDTSAAAAANDTRLPVLFRDDDGSGDGSGAGDTDGLDGFPGERKLYLAYHNDVSATSGKDVAGVDEMEGEDGNPSAVGVAVEDGNGGMGGALAGEDGSGGSSSGASIDGVVAPAEAADTAAGEDDGDDDDLFGDQGDASFEQTWDDLVEGVADEGVLHGHGRAGLPDPLEEDAVDALLEEAAAIDGDDAAAGHHRRGLDDASDGVVERGGGSGDEGDRDDGFEDSLEEQEGGAPLACGRFPPAPPAAHTRTHASKCLMLPRSIICGCYLRFRSPAP